MADYPVHMNTTPEVKAFFDPATNTISYVVRDPDSDSCAIVDSVMDIDYAAGRITYDNADAIIAYVQEQGLKVEWLIETHVHADHLSAAPYIQEKLGGKIGIGSQIKTVQDTFGKVFNEGTEFQRDGSQFDRLFDDGDTYSVGQMECVAIHTPGHASNHLCYFLEEERTLFSGDHIMNGSTVVIAPPDGDMAAYLDSLEKVRIKRLRAIAPGHGHLITEPYDKIDEYVAHRLEREAQVLAAVKGGTTTIDAIVAALYPGLVEELVPRAAQSVHAHLRKLAADGAVTGDDPEGAWTA